MKTLRAVLALSAIVTLGAAANEAFAGGRYGWGSAGYCGGTDGYGCSGGCGYAGCGEFGYAGGGGYGGSGSTFWIVGDYAPYIIGHGPMFPAGESPHPAFWYDSLSGADKSLSPNRK